MPARRWAQRCSATGEPPGLAMPVWSADRSRGFTMAELVIAIAILATVTGIGISTYRTALENARVARTIADVRVLEKDLAIHKVHTERLPDSLAELGRGNRLDAWGRSLEYLRFCEPGETRPGHDCESRQGKMRRDGFLKPLNSDYDLYSTGKDGKSKAKLDAKESADDIVRAVDGAYVGLASEF